MLAQQLKTRRPVELGPRLEHLLAARRTAASSAASDATLPELVASLQLSLDQLDEAARQMLPRLGVFQGGAMEPDLLAITEISEDVWPALRQQLEAAALIEAETLPGVDRAVPPVSSHAGADALGATQQGRAGQLSWPIASDIMVSPVSSIMTDTKNPHGARAIAWRELPNMLHAVHAALDAAMMTRSILPTP